MRVRRVQVSENEAIGFKTRLLEVPLSIARGSLSELDTQVQIAVMLSYIAEDQPLHGLLDRVGKLLSGFSKKLKMDAGKT